MTLPIDYQTGEYACNIRVENGIVLPASHYDTNTYKYKSTIAQVATEHKNTNTTPFLYRSITSYILYYIRVKSNYHVEATDYDNEAVGAHIFYEPIANIQQFLNLVRIRCQKLNKTFITNYDTPIYILNNHTV
jgi:hypothetical protein